MTRFCFSSRRDVRAAFIFHAAILTILVLASSLPAAADAVPSEKFELKPHDHICIIGNTLADRMQHDGWLETYLYGRFPDYDLVIRNLGFSGDELTLRLRSQSFGTPDQWLAGSAPVPEPNRLTTRIGVRDNRFELTNTKADVVFAFFGYNESFTGKAGLPKFKKDLEEFIQHTRRQKYNGETAPRLVLFSPIGFEDHMDPNLPDGNEINQRLALYTAAMAEVSAANHVPFVDLFNELQPTLEAHRLQAWASKPIHGNKAHPAWLGLPFLTINGIHLNAHGNREVAKIIDRELFRGQPEPKREPDSLEKLRQAVLDKNFYWFNRYRVLDGYNVYGGRAFEKYADKQSNYEDQQRELEILDVLTANRDKRIWAVARGEDFAIDDSNTPPYIPVKTNKPGNGLDGTHLYLDGEEAIEKMTLAEGMKVMLFASEKEFPELAKPVQMQFDAQGRLWVAVWPSYPHWKPKEEMNDKILIFEDTKGTGKADRMTVFADHLNCPTGFEFYNGGVLVAQAPDLIFLKDTKGLGKADLRVRVLHGLDSADSHHTSNSFALDPGGALYFQEGTFHHSQVETAYGPPVRCANGAVYRYEPRTQKFETYVTTPFANPHGHVWDRWGQDFVYDGTGANPYHGALFSGHLDFPVKHPKPPQVYQQRTRPCPGVEILSSRHFPAQNQGNLLVANVIGFQGILQYKVDDSQSSFTAMEVEPIISSTDPNFRPSDLKIGPDGAIWFIDWHNTIIGHLQHALRDPNRDRTHGRIYRITCEDRSLLEPPKIAGEPMDRLLELLKEPEDRLRYRAKIELGARNSDQVIAAVGRWLANLDKKDPEYEHHVMEGLWVHQYHNVVNADLLKRMLASPDFRARAAATRVLCYWRDRVPDTLDWLRKLAADPHPRVRLEAVRAASFLTMPEAIEIPLISLEYPADPYLDYTRGETMKALEPYWKKAVAEGRKIAFASDAGARFLLRSMSNDELLKMPRNRAVYLELLFRKGVRDEHRREALTGLAKLENKPELRVLLSAIENQDSGIKGPGSKTKTQETPDESVVFDHVRLLTSRTAAELQDVRADLEKMIVNGNQPVTRELGYVAIIAADDSVDKAWQLATRSVAALTDLLHAIPLIRDPGLRAGLYPKIEPLLDGLPKNLASSSPGNGTRGRFVRIELPGRRKTLTLAEVEVYSQGRNIARQGKASQKNSSNGGDAAKAIDGNKSGKFADGGQTHTEENTSNPWWEVDLGREFPIDAIVIYNRTEGVLGNRLNGFTLSVLDQGRNAVFTRQKIPAPAEKAEFKMAGSGPESAIRHATMAAMVSVRGQETQAFKSLARFVAVDQDRHPAIQALQKIPARQWPPEEIKPVLDKLLGYIRKLPAQERTSPVALDALQLADTLAARLPLDQARLVRKELGELGVRIIRLGTVTDQMLFDKEQMVVQAGKPVEIIFENTDLMPHNFVVVRPGALEKIGTLAEAQAAEPGAVERHYVPASNKILLKSRLLQPRDSQKLSFTAPKEHGVYPYVCTYPGHWRRMFGALYVVADLEQYLADAEGYLAKNPLPVVDELLKSNRPRKEWKLEDLAAAVELLGRDRSFSNGKQMFQVASCVSCHKMNGVGTEIGPNLTKLDPKQQAPIEILRDIIEPSFRINEKYQSFVFETQAGKVVTGLILEENNDFVKVIENPLLKAKPVLLKKSEIAGREKSPTSIMPKGLLDKLTREEILDLIAYIVSGGDVKHKVYQGGGHSHGH